MRYGRYVTNKHGKRVFKDDINVELAVLILEGLNSGVSLTAKSISKLVCDVGSKKLLTVINNNPRHLRTKLGNMRRESLVETIESIDGVHYQISDEGITKLQKLTLKELDTTTWDSKWRVLSYDIPETKRMARDAIRSLIRNLGMVQIHRSVWVTPFDCSKQVNTLKSVYKIEEDLLFLVTDEIDQEEKLKEIFF